MRINVKAHQELLCSCEFKKSHTYTHARILSSFCFSVISCLNKTTEIEYRGKGLFLFPLTILFYISFLLGSRHFPDNQNHSTGETYLCAKHFRT